MIVGRKVDGKKVGRQAWIALILTIPAFMLGQAIGDAVASLLGYDNPTPDTVPLWAKLVVLVLAMAPTVTSAVLAAKWGRLAFLNGNRQARIPGIAAIVFLIFIGTVTLLSLVGLA